MNRTRRPTTADHGFTLIELLVVVIIIGILAGIAIPIFMNQKAKAHDAAVKADLASISKAVETEGGTLTGALYRGAGDASVVDAAGNAAPVKLSDGTSWGISGTVGAYCATAWSDGGSRNATHPITYDSAAGGLDRSGKACDLAALPVASVASSGGGGGAVFVAGRNLLGNSAFQTVTPAKLDAIIPTATVTDGIGYTGAGQWRYTTTQSPVGSRTVELITSNGAASQGVVFYPDAALPMPVGTPRVVDGQVHTLSAYVKAPFGQNLYLTARTVRADRSWVAEDYTLVTGTGTWQRVETTSTGTPATAGQILALQVQTFKPWPVIGTSIFVAGPQIESGAASTPFEVTPTR